MADELETIARFSSPMEAELTRGRLEEEGIQARLMGVTSSGLLTGIDYITGGIDLLVTREDAERARRVLAELAAEKDTPSVDMPLPEPYEQEPEADRMVRRAYRASWLGYFVCFFLLPVINGYSLVLLLIASTKDPPISQNMSWRFYAALLLDLLALLIWLSVWVAILGH